MYNSFKYASKTIQKPSQEGKQRQEPVKHVSYLYEDVLDKFMNEQNPSSQQNQMPELMSPRGGQQISEPSNGLLTSRNSNVAKSTANLILNKNADDFLYQTISKPKPIEQSPRSLDESPAHQVQKKIKEVQSTALQNGDNFLDKLSASKQQDYTQRGTLRRGQHGLFNINSSNLPENGRYSVQQPQGNIKRSINFAPSTNLGANHKEDIDESILHREYTKLGGGNLAVMNSARNNQRSSSNTRYQQDIYYDDQYVNNNGQPRRSNTPARGRQQTYTNQRGGGNQNQRQVPQGIQQRLRNQQQQLRERSNSRGQPNQQQSNQPQYRQQQQQQQPYNLQNQRQQQQKQQQNAQIYGNQRNQYDDQQQQQQPRRQRSMSQSSQGPRQNSQGGRQNNQVQQQSNAIKNQRMNNAYRQGNAENSQQVRQQLQKRTLGINLKSKAIGKRTLQPLRQVPLRQQQQYTQQQYQEQQQMTLSQRRRQGQLQKRQGQQQQRQQNLNNRQQPNQPRSYVPQPVKVPSVQELRYLQVKADLTKLGNPLRVYSLKLNAEENEMQIDELEQLNRIPMNQRFQTLENLKPSIPQLMKTGQSAQNRNGPQIQRPQNQGQGKKTLRVNNNNAPRQAGSRRNINNNRSNNTTYYSY